MRTALAVILAGVLYGGGVCGAFVIWMWLHEIGLTTLGILLFWAYAAVLGPLGWAAVVDRLMRL